MTGGHGHTVIVCSAYDPIRRRVCGSAASGSTTGPRGSLLAALGAALVAHDWKDRPVWFQRGAGRTTSRG